MKAKDIQLVCTCQVCPEQYDAFDGWGLDIGYLHLRNGIFTARNNDNEVLYKAELGNESGYFRSDEERETYLTLGKEALAKYYTGRMGKIKMKTFEDLYKFAQGFKGYRIPLSWQDDKLSCYSLNIFGSGEIIIIEGPNPYFSNPDPLPLFRITYFPSDELVYFNDLNDSGCDVCLNKHCLPMDSKFTKMADFEITRTIVIYLLTRFGEDRSDE